jgi:hypothetical protein
VLTREHVDDVHLTGVSVVGSEHVRYRSPECLAEERVMHEDGACVIRHLPVNDAGGDGFDNPSTLPVTETLDITPGHHGQFAVYFDTDDSRVWKHPGDQQGFALARSEIDECSGVRQLFEHPRERGSLASQVRPVFGVGVVGIDFGSSRTDSFGVQCPSGTRSLPSPRRGVPVPSGLSSRCRGPARFRGNSAAYYLFYFHENGNPARSGRAPRGGAARQTSHGSRAPLSPQHCG